MLLNNDISNKAAPVLCFNFERIICEKFEHKFFKYKYSLDYQNINAINQLWKKDFYIMYVTFLWPDKKVSQLEEELDDTGACLYNGVMKVKSNSALKHFLVHNLGSAYYDTDKEIVDNLYPYAALWQGYLISLWNKE